MTEQLPRACKGMDVVVRDARGDYLQKRAISNIESGHDFPVVFVAWRDDPDSEMPWPLEDVWLDSMAPEQGLSHAEYRQKWGLAPV